MSPHLNRPILFISIVTIVIVFLSFYLGHHIRTRFHLNGKFQWMVWLILTSFVILQILGPLLYSSGSNIYQRPFVIQWVTYTSLGLFSTLLIYIIASDLLLFVWSRFREVPLDSKRRLFFMVSGISIFSVFAGAYQAIRGPVVMKTEIPIKDLDEDLEGFKIIQISDLHIGPIIDKNYTQNIVDIVNRQNPDLIAVTGDMVDGTIEQLEEHVLPLAQLQAKYGVFYCTGNHEYYWGAKVWVQKFRSLGFKPLLNEHVNIKVGQSLLCIGGVNDLKAEFFDIQDTCSPKKAFESAPEKSWKLLLAHQPNTYKRIEDQNVHLQLSGHTHGGQFFPWNIIVSLAQTYYAGLYLHNKKTWIYVNRGTGFWGPPHRLGVPSEVSVLTLKRALEAKASTPTYSSHPTTSNEANS